ncbi:MAG: hypothetical protein U0894_04800 [Pirellulales bacterium]
MSLNPYDPPSPSESEKPPVEEGAVKQVTTVEDWFKLAMPLAIASGGIACAISLWLIVAVSDAMTQVPQGVAALKTGDIPMYAIGGATIGCYTGLICLPLLSYVPSRHLLSSILGGLFAVACAIAYSAIMAGGIISPSIDDASFLLACFTAAWVTFWFFGYRRRSRGV